jgi:hypothetical protein
MVVRSSGCIVVQRYEKPTANCFYFKAELAIEYLFNPR